MSLWKDEESEGPDALLLAELDLQVKQASVAQFDGQLHTETFEAVDSKGNYVMQLADLYTGAVSRRLNREESGNRNHKDELADHILDLIGRQDEQNLDFDGNIGAHLRL